MFLIFRHGDPLEADLFDDEEGNGVEGEGPLEEEEDEFYPESSQWAEEEDEEVKVTKHPPAAAAAAAATTAAMTEKVTSVFMSVI